MTQIFGRSCSKVLNVEESQLKTMRIFLTTWMLCEEPLTCSLTSQALRSFDVSLVDHGKEVCVHW